MTKYEVIKNIMENPDLDEDSKVWKIEWFLRGWITEERAVLRSEGYGCTD